MDSVNLSVVTPSKSRLARTFAKVLHARAVAGIVPDDQVQDTKSHETKAKKKKKDVVKKSKQFAYEDEDSAVRQAFVAKLFASLSAVKAAYAQLQLAQSPYDPDGIQSADQALVSELKNLSELKQRYLKQNLEEKTPPETTLLLSEILEQMSLLKTYEVTSKKMDSQLRLKDSEITFLREKLAEANSENKLLEKRLNSSGHLAIPDNIQLSSLKASHFIACYKQAIKSVRSFVSLLAGEMESAGWDLVAAARSIQPGISFWQSNHTCLAFESFVCREMFDGFNYPNFSTSTEEENSPRLFFDRFTELKSVRPTDYLAWKPKSTFARFCRDKYSRLVHPKMEMSFFGNLQHRSLVNSGELPEMPFFLAFSEMAKRVWLLHCLARSFDPEVSIFQVSKGARFSEVYMASLSDEAFLSNQDGDPRVAFVVVPGFRIGKTVVQCQVYLS